MRTFFLTTFAAYLIISACTKPVNGDSSNLKTLPIDTVKIAAIDTITNGIDRQWKASSNLHRVMVNDRDSVQYFEINGEAQRISSMFYSDSTMTWATFHKINNKLLRVRFRQVKNHPPQRNVLEAFSYFENGKIFYSKERTVILDEWEPIARFREADFIENARKPEELIAEYMPFWDISIKALDAHQAERKKNN